MCVGGGGVFLKLFCSVVRKQLWSCWDGCPLFMGLLPVIQMNAAQSLAINCIIYMSLVMRKPPYCICENKDADQLRSNREADQRLCFRYRDSTILLLPKSEISSL